MTLDTEVVVVGAGVSGLTTAYLLARSGVPVEIVEASSRVGGVIATEQHDGILYERGPNSALDTHPCIGELIAALGIAGERIETKAEAATRYVVKDGRLAALPLSPPAFLRTPLFSLRAKLGLALEPFVRPASPAAEESVTQFVTRRLGREFLDYAIEPFVAGVYAGNPDELSVGAAFPRLHALEQRYGSLIRGQIKGARERARRSVKGRNAARSFSFRSGMQTLTDALACTVNPVRLSSAAKRIERRDDGTLSVEVKGAADTVRISARVIVLAVPADTAAALVREHAPAAAEALNTIVYAPVAPVACAYARANVAHPLDGFGFLLPRVEKGRVLGALFSSSMFEGRASEGEVLITAFVGGRRQPGLAHESEEAIAALVQEELASLLGARNPRRTAVTRWPWAIPQYTLGHAQRLAHAAEAERALPGLFLCGSYGGGVSVGDCIKSAHDTAERIGGYLRAR
jgi:protoporphyrinogen/coproporphyrinogen III oxidase